MTLVTAILKISSEIVVDDQWHCDCCNFCLAPRSAAVTPDEGEERNIQPINDSHIFFLSCWDLGIWLVLLISDNNQPVTRLVWQGKASRGRPSIIEREHYSEASRGKYGVGSGAENGWQWADRSKAVAASPLVYLYLPIPAPLPLGPSSILYVWKVGTVWGSRTSWKTIVNHLGPTQHPRSTAQ